MANGGPKKGTHKEACSFCGKSTDAVHRLIRGAHNTYICDECVELCHSIVQQEAKYEGKPKPAAQETPTPAQIKSALDEYVIGQEKAKMTVAVAVHNHYRRISYQAPDEVELEKSNVLLIGPSGSGKTLIARILAKTLNVPFAIADATTLTEAGYVGEDVENVLLKLIQNADWDVQQAQRGIIYIDEIDKIRKTYMNVSITRDVGGEGVQQALLKMLEGTTSNVPTHAGRKHPEEQYMQIDTTNILFMCGGTFNGIDELIRKRTNQQAIGFATTPGEEAETHELAKLLPLVTDDDLIHFGMIPELVGRLPVIAPLLPLTDQELVKVLLEPRNAIIRQYQRFFEFEGANLEFTPEALLAIARRAIDKGTGARALRAVLEEIMLEPMFHLPSAVPKGQRYVVTPEVVRGQKPLLEHRQRKSA